MEKKPYNFLNIFLAFAAVVLLMIGGAAIFWFYQQNLAPKADETTKPSPAARETAAISPSPKPPTATPTTATTVPGDEEPEPEAEAPDDTALIRQAMADKYDRPVEDVILTVSDNTGTHANGGVRFEEEMGGGWWLAYKDGDNWIIVADGNGTVPCSAIEGYDFPTDMVPECWDEDTGELVVR